MTLSLPQTGLIPVTITPETTVNEVLRQSPGAISVLNAFGVDSCCGGSASLSAAATNARIPLATLLAALEAASNSGTTLRADAGGDR